MRIEPQVFVNIEPGGLVATAHSLKDEGYRFVQCCAAEVDGRLELTYSFDKDMALKNFRLDVAPAATLESVSSIFPAAFVFENEMHDLFGLEITGISIDFQGAFYEVREKTPMIPEADETAGQAQDAGD